MITQGIADCYTDIDSALKEHPEAAIIAGPSTTHVEYGLTLARAGVHLLVEKTAFKQSRRYRPTHRYMPRE